MDEVFISSAGTDADRRIVESLSNSLGAHGIRTWSLTELDAGADLTRQVMGALERAVAVLVIVTPFSLTRKWVEDEWSHALRNSKRVIPVLAGGASGGDLPRELAAIEGVDLNENFDDGVRKITEAVRLLTKSDEPSASEYVDDIRGIVEDVVDRKLASLGVDKPMSAEAAAEDPGLVFVITSFQDDMQPAFEAIAAAAKSVGLRAERVKDVMGDYRITDKILSGIRQAGLVVVDLTHERPNVYFELGFARGLGKTVITIMREGAEAHFDVQDWTYLTYIDSRPLERALVERFDYELQQRNQGSLHREPGPTPLGRVPSHPSHEPS